MLTNCRPPRRKKEATASADQSTKVIQAPAATKPALPPSRTVNLDTIDYDQSGNIVFGGSGPAGSKVQLYVDNNAYGLAFINDKGTWTFAGLSSLTVGPHTLRANEIGDDGAVKSRIEMPFYRDDPAKVATAPQTPATPQAPKPAEVATAKEVPVPMPPAEMKKKEATASTGQPDMEKTVEVPAEKQTAPVEMKKKETTASIDKPDLEKTVEVPAGTLTVPVDEKKKVAASTDRPEIKKAVEMPVNEPIVPVDEKKKATASINQPAIKKTVKATANEPAATVNENKMATASIDQPAIKKTVKAPEPIVPVNENKMATASIDQPAIKKTIQATVDEPTVPVDGRKKKKKKNALSKLRLQSTQRVIPKTNLRDAGAESWRVNCSPMFGGWSKASETYLSSAGKRVSCAKRPKNARG